MRGGGTDKIINSENTHGTLNTKSEIFKRFMDEDTDLVSSSTKVLEVEYSSFERLEQNHSNYESYKDIKSECINDIQSEIIRKDDKYRINYSHCEISTIDTRKSTTYNILDENSILSLTNSNFCVEVKGKKEKQCNSVSYMRSPLNELCTKQNDSKYILRSSSFLDNVSSKSCGIEDTEQTDLESIKINIETIAQRNSCTQGNLLLSFEMPGETQNDESIDFENNDSLVKLKPELSGDFSYYDDKLKSAPQYICVIEAIRESNENLSYVLSLNLKQASSIGRQAPNEKGNNDPVHDTKPESILKDNPRSDARSITLSNFSSFGGGGGGGGDEDPPRRTDISKEPDDNEEADEDEQMLENFLLGMDSYQQLSPKIIAKINKFLLNPSIDGALGAAVKHFTTCKDFESCALCEAILEILAQHLKNCFYDTCNIVWCQQYHSKFQRKHNPMLTLKKPKFQDRLRKYMEEQINKEKTCIKELKREILECSSSSFTTSSLTRNPGKVRYTTKYSDFKSFQDNLANSQVCNEGFIWKKMSKKISIFNGGYKLNENYTQLSGLGNNKGGQGKIYQVKDLETGYIFAIKQEVLAKHIEYNLSEVETWAKAALEDDQIVQFYGVIKENDKLNLLMEYIEGEDLESMIKTSKKLSVKQTIFYIKGVCQQLSVLHKLNIVHEDIKAANVMVRRRNGRPVLVDFGLSRFLTENHRGYRGSIFAFSPEKVRGEYNKAADIWAIGIMAAHVITGEVPWADCRGEIVFTIGMCKRPPILEKLSKYTSSKRSLKDFFDKVFEIEHKKRIEIDNLLRHTLFREVTYTDEMSMPATLRSRQKSRNLNVFSDENSPMDTSVPDEDIMSSTFFNIMDRISHIRIPEEVSNSLYSLEEMKLLTEFLKSYPDPEHLETFILEVAGSTRPSQQQTRVLIPNKQVPLPVFLQQERMATPDRQAPLPAVLQQERAATPYRQAPLPAVLQQERAATPNRQAPLPASLQQDRMATPNRQAPLPAVLQQERAATPNRQAPLPASLQQDRMATPNRQAPLPAVLQQERAATPNRQAPLPASLQQDRMATPNRQAPLPAVLQQERAATPNRQAPLPASLQQDRMATPNRQAPLPAVLQQDISRPSAQNLPQVVCDENKSIEQEINQGVQRVDSDQLPDFEALIHPMLSMNIREIDDSGSSTEIEPEKPTHQSNISSLAFEDFLRNDLAVIDDGSNQFGTLRDDDSSVERDSIDSNINEDEPEVDWFDKELSSIENDSTIKFICEGSEDKEYGLRRMETWSNILKLMANKFHEDGEKRRFVVCYNNSGRLIDPGEKVNPSDDRDLRTVVVKRWNRSYSWFLDEQGHIKHDQQTP
ncbi:DgyrCDS1393 [Dimorphilus gyrociliatus]|nr:DgyrCDS1393 [Dimorphilus gyrociliatus]